MYRSLLLRHSSVLVFTFPNDQINQRRDEAHGEEGEDDHHALRCIFILRLDFCTALEELGVDEKEDVMGDGVRIKAIECARRIFQAETQLIVWPVTDREALQLMIYQPMLVERKQRN